MFSQSISGSVTLLLFFYLALTLLFATFIWGLGRRHPQCIAGVDFEKDYFTDAFVLSWTTFSTVGYGVIHVSTDHHDVFKCTGITILLSLEAFVGVLFASFVCAVSFAKVGRTQSFAQVQFSDLLVVRYNSGLPLDHLDDSSHHHPRHRSGNGKNNLHLERGTAVTDFGALEKEGSEQDCVSCPILEFQLVNCLRNVPVGQIVNATINMVAHIDARQVLDADQTVKGRKSRPSKNERIGSRPTTGSDNCKVSLSRYSTLAPSFEEDATGHLISKRSFAPMHVVTRSHPVVQHTWLVRHILNEHSPILQPWVREKIQACGGRWPTSLSDFKGIRKAIGFAQILVSFHGLSNADGKRVYAHKIYELGALVVGYRFVNAQSRDHQSLRQSDSRLVNNVAEQRGGGGEPIINRRKQHYSMRSSATNVPDWIDP